MFEWSFEDLVREFISRSGPPAREVTHVLEDGVEDHAALLPQLVLVHQLLEERPLDRLATVAPQLLAAGFAGGAQSKRFRHGAFWRGSGRENGKFNF